MRMRTECTLIRGRAPQDNQPESPWLLGLLLLAVILFEAIMLAAFVMETPK
jgi:hypothetical protein